MSKSTRCSRLRTAILLLAAHGLPFAALATDPQGAPAGGDSAVSTRIDAPSGSDAGGATTRNAPVSNNAGPSTTQSAPVATETQVLAPITVTSGRLHDNRIELSPSVGTTLYTVDSAAVANLSQGAASSFDEVLLHMPGVSKDSKASGALHVRDDHGNVQYRVNGVQLPENLSGFGEAIDARFVDSIGFLTGALPAQYGLHTAGVVEIQTREGKITPGGSLDLQLGSHATVQPGAQLFGAAGDVSWYLSASGLSSQQGIENPQSSRNALHDGTAQTRTFANLNWFVDDASRAALMFGSYRGSFQIPDNPGQPALYALAGPAAPAGGAGSIASSGLDERQREQNQFVVAAWQHSGDAFDYQISAFHQYSGLHFFPDLAGDLIFNGVAAEDQRSASSNGAQLDGAWRVGKDHTLRGGVAFSSQLSSSNNRVAAFPVNAAGAPQGLQPVQIIDDSSKSGSTDSQYLQDEWHALPELTINAGLRRDRVAAFTEEQQWSPRLNLAWTVNPQTSLHGGFSRYFTPPPQELAAAASVALYAGTTNAAAVTASGPVRAERSRYFDLGLAHALSPRLKLTVDVFDREVQNLLDEGQFGQALILSPFNYAHGSVRGVELAGIWSAEPVSAYANLAWQRALAGRIISGQSLFSASTLAYVAGHDIHLDHDQQLTASAGASAQFGPRKFSVDALSGSGLRNTGSDGVPNGDHLPGYAVVNLALSQKWPLADQRSLEGRISLLNLFDRSYLLRDGTGIGVGAPQFGLRRALFGSASLQF